MIIGVRILFQPFKRSGVIRLLRELLKEIVEETETVLKDSFLCSLCVILVFCLFCFILGVFIQIMYKLSYNRESKGGKSEENEQSEFKHFLARLIHKVNKNRIIEGVFEENRMIISNSLKGKIYSKYAALLVNEKKIWLTKNGERIKRGVQTEADTSEDGYQIPINIRDEYFFAYCVYYLRTHNQDAKTEKLRDIEGLSESLSLVFLILAVISAILTAFLTVRLLFVPNSILKDGIWLELLCALAFSAFSIVFDYQAEEALKNRIRMTFALYEAEKDREAESYKSGERK